MDYILLKKKWWKFFSVFFFIANSIQLQPISPSNFIYKYKNVMHDNGIWWDKLSTISSNRYDYSENNVENINFLNKGFRIVLDKNNTVFNLFGNLLLKNNLYIYYNSDLYSNVNLSGFGFHNNWVALQIGKGREVWGAGNDINLALSDNANPYNYFMLSSVLDFFNRKDLIKWIFPFGLVYSFYIVLIVLLSFTRSFEWKGRIQKR